MARADISDEELLLKKRARRRLMGAIALVLIVVVFLPMLLDSEPKPLSEDIAINIPPMPPADQAPALAAPAPEQNPAVAPDDGESKASIPPAAPSAAESSTTGSAGQPTAAAPKTAAAAANAESYVVQLGAFSSPAKARQLVAKLKENRFKAYTQTVKTAGGELTRVRVGSYPSREAAEKARAQMKARKLVIGEASVVRNDI
jgi:DedD protein